MEGKGRGLRIEAISDSVNAAWTVPAGCQHIRHAKRSVSTTKYFSNGNSSTLVPWCVAVATEARVQYHTMETDKRQWTRIQQWVHVHSGERPGQWPRQLHHRRPTRAYLTFLSNLQRFHSLHWVGATGQRGGGTGMDGYQWAPSASQGP